jgi:hypothetical protein
MMMTANAQRTTFRNFHVINFCKNVNPDLARAGVRGNFYFSKSSLKQKSPFFRPGEQPDPCAYVKENCTDASGIIPYLELYYCEAKDVKWAMWVFFVRLPCASIRFAFEISIGNMLLFYVFVLNLEFVVMIRSFGLLCCFICLAPAQTATFARV